LVVPGVLLAMIMSACGSNGTSSAPNAGAVNDVTSSTCPDSSSQLGDDSGLSSLFASALGSVASGALSAGGGDLTGWLLSAAGVSGNDSSALLKQIGAELQQIN
jgi:hypothetical protein